MSGIYIGLISGTSADAIDAVAVEISDHHKISQLAALAYSIDKPLRQKIFSIQSRHTCLNTLGELDTQLGEAFANAALALINNKRLDKSKIQAIGCHGQTIKHDADCAHPFTIQIGNPSIVAERTAITTVADFRRRDIAAGGQGAPLVPAFHQAWLGKHKNTVVLNMGGVANITVLGNNSAQPRAGFDTGPANTLLDSFARQYLQKAYDEGGQWARSGKIHPALLADLLTHPYFRKTPPKSADISQFSPAWLNNFLQPFANIAPQDIAATLLELTVSSIAQAIDTWAAGTEQVVSCGGGSKNQFLMEELAKRLHPIRLTASNKFGIQTDWVEATAFAWLARQTLLKKPGNAHHATGARHARILGGVYYA